jgi:hypothetical protein
MESCKPGEWKEWRQIYINSRRDEELLNKLPKIMEGVDEKEKIREVEHKEVRSREDYINMYCDMRTSLIENLNSFCDMENERKVKNPENFRRTLEKWFMVRFIAFGMDMDFILRKAPDVYEKVQNILMQHNQNRVKSARY